MNLKEKWMIEHGFSSTGEIYVVGGGNTYLIKDELKNAGFRYSELLGWYSSCIREVPASYQLYCLTFDELYQWEPQFNKAFLYKDAKDKIKEKTSWWKESNESCFIGQPNERLYDLFVKFKNFKYIYPYYIYNFLFKNNKMVWVTKKQIALAPDQDVNLTCTVAAHEDFKGNKITRIKRCVIKPK